MSDPIPISTLIDRCLPGDEPEELERRVAILRVAHACSVLDDRIEWIGLALNAYLRDPDTQKGREQAWELLVETDKAPQELEVLAREIRKSRPILKRLAGLRA